MVEAPHKNPNYFRELLANQPHKFYVAAIDIGSTSIKGGLMFLKYGNTGPDTSSNLTQVDNTGFRLNYSFTQVYHDEKPFKFMSSDQTQELLSKLRQGWQIAYDTASNLGADAMVSTALTGFTQSLAVRYKDKTIILLDEPSLITKPTDVQIDTLKKYIGEDGIRKEISSIIKLLSLKNHPYLIKKIFGEEAHFSRLRFSTMLGALTSEITGVDTHFNIPLADLNGFGKKDFTLSEAQEMLRQLGFQNSQITIDSSRFSRENHGNIFVINDFEAEISLIDELRKNEKIKSNAIVIGLSSVGKIVISSKSSARFKGVFPKTEETYTTQRMGANALSKWGPFLFPDPNNVGTPDYKTINEILYTAANGQVETPYVYFPEIHDEDSIGSLYKNSDTGLIKINSNQLTTANIETKKQMILALAEGITFGLREKVENIWKENKENKSPILFYGGLLDNQSGWIKIVQQSLPETDVSYLNIPNANYTAAYLSIKNFDPTIPKIEISIKSFKNEEYHRENEYRRWKESKKIMEIKQ